MAIKKAAGAVIGLSAIFILLITPPTGTSRAADSESLENPYSILNEKRDEEPQKVLFITSYYTDVPEGTEFTVEKIEVFRDIISSRWNIDVTILNEQNYKYGLVNDYDIVFLIKEDKEPINPIITYDLALTRDKKVALIGQSNEVVDALTGSKITPRVLPITKLEYKNIEIPGEDFELLFDAYEAGNSIKNGDVYSIGENKDAGNYPIAFSLDNSRFFGEDNKSEYIVFPFFLPFYYAIDNQVIVFLDLLHEVLGEDHIGIQHPTALIRLEDVNVSTYFNPNQLRNVYEYLKEENLPFHVAIIPRFIDPINGIDMTLKDGRRFFHLLNEMVGDGLGVLVQHGYTHQEGGSVSGIGFEFWDEETKSPLPYDSEEFALNRLSMAQESMRESGLIVPDIWETPHYALSDLDDEVVNSVYPIRYEHMKNFGVLPFIAKIGDTIYVPENLGFISDPSDNFINGQTVEELKERMEYLAVFRNATASFFWHPWRDLGELKDITSFIKTEGYDFVSVYDLLEDNGQPNALISLKALRERYHSPISYALTNLLAFAVYAFFVLGCVFYIRTIIRLKKYIKVIDTFNMSIGELRKIFSDKSKDFPFFTIFVPARNEGYVIENTVRRLASLDYPKDSYKVVVITDERELQDGVEVTTKEVVERVGREINSHYGTELVQYVEVPHWYSGIYKDVSEGYGKSTKGRALNFALQTIEGKDFWDKTDMIGVLDADGRLHPNVLKEAAYSRVVNGSMVLQGPVFQFSNFNDVTITGIAAGIELAIHHLTELPANLMRRNRVQFLAGTNYFVDKNIISDVGGWNQDSLVEDAELALRIYVEKKVSAGWIGSPEIEQTPEHFSIYKKQRRRWVRGHLDLIKIIKTAEIPARDKMRFFWKIFVSQFRFVLDIGFPIASIAMMLLGIFIDLGLMVAILSLVLLTFAVFMWDLYGHMYRKLSCYINKDMGKRNKLVMSARLFVFSPVFMFIQSIPRIQALIDYALSAPENWYKTERTKENIAI